MAAEPEDPQSWLAICVAAGLVGLLIQLLLVGAGLGINVPIAVVAILLAGWLLRPTGAPLPALSDSWLPGGAVLLSAFVAIRGDATMVALDVAGAIILVGASIATFGGVPVVARASSSVLILAGTCIGWVLSGAAPLLARMTGSLGRMSHERQRLAAVAPVVRGLLIALPLLVLFVVLFAAADAVFASALDRVISLQFDLGDLPTRVVVALAAAWLAAGLLAFEAHEGAIRSLVPRDAAIPWSRRGLDSVEALTILAAVDALFAAFVAFQAAYLFGGADTLAASGLTYAEYARRGFFELVAVVVIAGIGLLILEAAVARKTRAYRIAAVGLCGLTGAVDASALLRLRLYQEAYGWTELRFYVAAAIVWLAICLVAAVACVAFARSRWLPHAVVISAFVVGVVCNAIGPVRFIAEQNVARALNPELVAPGGETGIDAAYLAGLGDDAIATLVDARTRLSGADLETLRIVLDARRAALARPEGSSWQGWSFGREAARASLNR